MPGDKHLLKFNLQYSGQKAWAIEAWNTARRFYFLLEHIDHNKELANLFGGNNKKHLHRTFLLWWTFTFEGFLQHLGSEIYKEDWEAIDKKPFKKKFKKIILDSGFKTNLGSHPFQTATTIHNIRNDLAHPKVEYFTNSNKLATKPPAKGETIYPFKGIKIDTTSPLVRKLDHLSAERAYQDIREILISLYKAHNILDDLPFEPKTKIVLGMPQLPH